MTLPFGSKMVCNSTDREIDGGALEVGGDRARYEMKIHCICLSR